jgi:uncharacterized delta-60 repeat protein
MMGRWRSTEKGRRKPPVVRANLGLEALEERTLLNAGSLDLGFGIGGKSIVQGTGQGFDATLQSDGKIVIVGGLNGDFSIARINPGGSPDSTFGSNGVVTTDLGSSQDQAEGVVIQPDGKIVVAGFMLSINTGRDFAVVRYNSNGTLDTTFGAGGIVTTDFNGLNDQAGDVLLQPDGKILALGTATVSSTDSNFALARYNANGSLDNSFGTAGKVTTNIGPFDQGQRGVLQGDGKIILVGGSGFNVLRYNPNGTLDSSFGTGGIVSILAESIAEDVALRTDGKIVVGGTLTNGIANTDFQAAQFLPNGALDTTWATGGVVTTFFPGSDAFGFALAIQTDGSVVLGGNVSSNNTLADDWALVRYTVLGNPDFSFGFNGKVITDMGSDLEEIHSLLIPASNQLLAVGLTGSSFGLARYQAQSPQPVDISANALYVDQLFLQLLGRQADNLARTTFSAFLDNFVGNRFLTPQQNQQVARMQLVQIMQAGVEYRTNEVQNLYQAILNRSADAAGLAAWVNFLGAGGTQQQVEAELMGSAEFIAAHGGTEEGFVIGVYKDILGRFPDSTGGTFWVNMLDAGATTESVVLGVLRSSEAATLTSGDLFINFLSRQPDTGALSFMVNAIAGGITNEYLVLFIVASQEFYDNAQSV